MKAREMYSSSQRESSRPGRGPARPALLPHNRTTPPTYRSFRQSISTPVLRQKFSCSSLRENIQECFCEARRSILVIVHCLGEWWTDCFQALQLPSPQLRKQKLIYRISFKSLPRFVCIYSQAFLHLLNSIKISIIRYENNNFDRHDISALYQVYLNHFFSR